MQFTTTPQDLLNAAATCDATNAQIQAQIGRIQSYIEGLMAVYMGPAATQLQATSEMWARDANALNAVLNTIAQGLRSNANNYSVNEGTNTTNLAQVASTLGAARL